MFATATIFAEVSAAQQPLAPTAKILKKDNQNLRAYYPYYPPYRPPYYPHIYYHPPYIYRPIYL
ncbi:MAG TPA: hypothetical protein VEG44_06515 [Candidatus Acidoferrales bacterium]|nr:hypothetical protein [Candidatus Acidoferrales bacterium]